jgi:hypothetical protein
MNRMRVVTLMALLATSLPAVRAEVAAAQHDRHLASASPTLIEAVRQATEPFRDVNNAAPDYGPMLGCVSGPEVGAMGVDFVDSPNRFGLPAHYELHVWAWRENPNGAFVDWHPRVSCEGQ